MRCPRSDQVVLKAGADQMQATALTKILEGKNVKGNAIVQSASELLEHVEKSIRNGDRHGTEKRPLGERHTFKTSFNDQQSHILRSSSHLDGFTIDSHLHYGLDFLFVQFVASIAHYTA